MKEHGAVSYFLQSEADKGKNSTRPGQLTLDSLNLQLPSGPRSIIASGRIRPQAIRRRFGERHSFGLTFIAPVRYQPGYRRFAVLGIVRHRNAFAGDPFQFVDRHQIAVQVFLGRLR